MNLNLRVVFDNNVLVSAALFESSVPNCAFKRALECGSVLYSLETLDELADVLSRPKLSRYLIVDKRDAYIGKFASEAVRIDVNAKITSCRDPKDNKFLELAVCGNATHIVTGDKDLLVLHPFRNVSILTPKEFLDSLPNA